MIIVILQTYNPEHEIINFVKQHSYSKFYKLQISERKSFNYPPFSRLLFVNFRHTDHQVLDSVIEKFSSFLRESFKNIKNKKPLTRAAILKFL